MRKHIYIAVLLVALVAAGCKKEELALTLTQSPMEESSPVQLFKVDRFTASSGSGGSETKDLRVYFTSYPGIVPDSSRLSKIIPFINGEAVGILELKRKDFLLVSMDIGKTYNVQLAYRLTGGGNTKLSKPFLVKL